MAFFGIFILAWVALLIFIIIICAILFVFIPSLVLSIVSLVKGLKNNWPIWTRVVLGICGTIVLIFIAFFIYYLVWRFAIYDPTAVDSSSSSEEMSNLILYLSLL